MGVKRSKVAETCRESARLRDSAREIQQILGKALGYSHNPNGICIGDHMAETIAAEAALHIEEQKALIGWLQLHNAILTARLLPLHSDFPIPNMAPNERMVYRLGFEAGWRGWPKSLVESFAPLLKAVWRDGREHGEDEVLKQVAREFPKDFGELVVEPEVQPPPLKERSTVQMSKSDRSKDSLIKPSDPGAIGAGKPSR